MTWLKAHKEAIMATILALQIIPGIPAWVGSLASSLASLTGIQ